jgi:glycosyltransferase involved in cell wall biosynthesis
MVDEDAAWLRDRKMHFVLVGDGMKMPIVREVLGDRCGEFVTLTGLVSQSEAPAYLAASDVLLSPHVANQDGTRFFGSPTKLFEYMAMGKAIVASDLDQIGQVLQNSVRAGDWPASNEPAGDDRRLAVLCPPGDVSSLIDSVKFTVDRPGWRAALGRHARAEALAKYTWRQHVAAILDRLQSVTR